MKNRALLFASFLLVTLAQNLDSPALAETNWMRKIAGTYQGKIWSDNVLLPAKTTFTVTSDGSVNGTYEADEGGLIVPGYLFGCKEIKTRTISCIWEDYYGRGPASFTFNPKYSKFDGYWLGDSGSKTYPWRGSRQ